MELFPAVLIGGPPNSGKSVLTYNLTQALREQGIQHYVLRAAPDGEGDWVSEAKQSIIRTILVPRTWTPAFVEHVCESLTHRPLPLLVDVGGRPTPWQEIIFDCCTHAVLLTPDESTHSLWSDLVSRHNLILLADLWSDLHGASQIMAARPVLQGVIAGLEWGERIGGPTFDVLLERIARLFAYDADELRRSHLAAAPVETAIDLDRLAHTLDVPFTGDKAIWQPDHLARLLDYLPTSTPLGLYGRGPNWLYAAAALHAYPEPFHQFDARLGWITPPSLRLGAPPAGAPVRTHSQHRADHVHVAFSITRAYLDYTEAEGLTIPPITPQRGMVLSGKLPLWLYTALALAYTSSQPHPPPWLAVYQPQLEAGDKAIIVSSRDPKWSVGDRIVSPPQKPATT
jgi:CRISPR-associated protein Csx3